MADNTIKTVTFEGAKLIYRNFAGREKLPYNPAGKRNFSVVLDPEEAEKMIKDGWPVKKRDARGEGEDPLYTLPVAVKYFYDSETGKPSPSNPKVYLVTNGKRTRLEEDDIAEIDSDEIEKANLTVVQRFWDFGNRSGVQARLKTLYVYISEDPLDALYRAEYEENGGNAETLDLETDSLPF